MLPPGIYDVTVRADGYGALTVGGVTIAAGTSTRFDVMLAPYEVVFEDDVESGNQGWTAESPWAITTEGSTARPTRGPTARPATTVTTSTCR